jgi:hypothetical protein
MVSLPENSMDVRAGLDGGEYYYTSKAAVQRQN